RSAGGSRVCEQASARRVRGRRRRTVAHLRRGRRTNISLEEWRRRRPVSAAGGRQIRQRLRAGYQARSQDLLRSRLLRVNADDMRSVVGEFIGTAMLLAAVVGSGIMGDRLAGGNVAIALLANSVATGAALIALILTFGPISGAHFNPAVSLADASQGGLRWSQAWAYVVAQVTGAVFGVGAADYMFQEPVFAWSRHVRAGLPQAFSEAIATFGLLAVIWSCSRRRSAAVPFAVGA